MINHNAIAARKEESDNWKIIVALSLLAALCFLYSAWPLWRAFFPLEIDTKEAWNAYHTDTVFGNGDLYPATTTLVANNYPPLSYYLIAPISLTGLDAIYVGRALSLLAVVAIAIMVTLIIRRFDAGWPAAILGGLWFLGPVVRFVDWYIAMNDPHLLALAISTAALLWFLHRKPQQGVELPILLIVVAGFFKHVLFATPATALLMKASQDWRLALRALLVGTCAAALGLVAFTAIYGTSFLDQLFFYPREYSILRGINSLERIAAHFPALGVWAAWAWYDRKSEAARFSAIFIALSLIVYVVQKCAEMTDQNAQFEFNVAIAVGIGLAFDKIAVVPIVARLTVERSRLAIVAILSICLLSGPGLEPYLLVWSSDYRAQFWENSEIMREEVRRIAAMPGPNVTCDVLTVCRAAGKPFIFDVTLVNQKYQANCAAYRRLQALPMAEGFRSEHVDVRAAVLPLFRQLPYGRTLRPGKPTAVELALSGSAPCNDGT